MSNVSVSRNTRMSDLLNYRLKITIVDGRTFVGQLLAFDKHMNLVLADTEEARITKKSYQELAKNKVGGQVKVAEEKRFLGLIILRGEQVVNLTIISGPTADIKKRLTQLKLGKGVSRPLKVPVSQKSKVKGPQRSV
ncbi:CIC11C00000003136 [Sungouiella intermedia]|uniref:Sm protein B n=1 Tax=Sungouiella intermedia TaxID=45354 RepID=A0A1L0BJV0_9ASCO|nr:CIC11C00000003136 [[Candida] intermedia]SGZ51435.1 CIC11C00000005151 [[Candida] intermedia]